MGRGLEMMPAIERRHRSLPRTVLNVRTLRLRIYPTPHESTLLYFPVV